MTSPLSDRAAGIPTVDEIMRVAAVANGPRRYRKFYPADAESLRNAIRYNPLAARIKAYSSDGFTRFSAQIVVVTATRHELCRLRGHGPILGAAKRYGRQGVA